MRYRAYKKFKYNAEIWDYTVVEGSDPVQRNYYLRTNLDIDIVMDSDALRLMVLCPYPIRLRAHLLHIRDMNGNEVFPGSQWQVTNMEPVLTPGHTREGFRMRAGLITNPDFIYPNEASNT
jgi:hypothetical protein